MKQTYSIEGMKCAGCINKITKVIKQTKVIKDYEFDLPTKSLIVSDESFDESKLLNEIENLGYKVTKQ